MAVMAEIDYSCGDPEVSDALYIARQVSCTEKGKGERGLVAFYRGLKESKPDKFAAELRALERDYRMTKVKGGEKAPAAAEADVGTGKCLGLAEALVKELTDGKVEKG